MKGCRLSSTRFTFYLFSFFLITFCYVPGYQCSRFFGRLGILNVLCACVAANLQVTRDILYLEQQSFSFSFVHRNRTLFGPPNHLYTCSVPCLPLCTTAATRSRPVRAAHIRKGLNALRHGPWHGRAGPFPNEISYCPGQDAVKDCRYNQHPSSTQYIPP